MSSGEYRLELRDTEPCMPPEDPHPSDRIPLPANLPTEAYDAGFRGFREETDPPR